MKHLDVLSDAGLVARSKTGRIVACRLDAEPMRDAFEWLNRYEKFWSERLSSLAAFLEEEESCPPKQPPSPHSTKPSLTLKRRLKAPPAKVFAAWIDPEKVKRWMGPGEIKALHVETDPRTGGRYRWVMQSADRRGARRQRRLSRGHSEREAGLHLGLEIDARA